MSRQRHHKIRRRSRRTCRILTDWRVEARVTIPDGVAATPQEIEAAAAKVYAKGGRIIDAVYFVRSTGRRIEAAADAHLIVHLMAEPEPIALEAVIG